MVEVPRASKLFSEIPLCSSWSTLDILPLIFVQLTSNSCRKWNLMMMDKIGAPNGLIKATHLSMFFFFFFTFFYKSSTFTESRELCAMGKTNGFAIITKVCRWLHKKLLRWIPNATLPRLKIQFATTHLNTWKKLNYGFLGVIQRYGENSYSHYLRPDVFLAFELNMITGIALRWSIFMQKISKAHNFFISADRPMIQNRPPNFGRWALKSQKTWRPSLL